MSKWSDWIDWAGGECPLPNKSEYIVRFRLGNEAGPMTDAVRLDWRHSGSGGDIIAYRYKIEESSSAEACNYPNCGCPIDKTSVCAKGLPEAMAVTEEEEEAWREKDVLPDWWKGHKEARKKERSLYDEIKEGFGSLEKAQTGKQPRYQDAKGEDWIDEFARTATVEEFRGAMKFTIGKYNRRAGKKDELVREIEKMRDYCGRWLEYERGRG